MKSKFSNLLHSDPMTDDDESPTNSGSTSPGYSTDRPNYHSPLGNSLANYSLSPWNAATSPFVKSPWIHTISTDKKSPASSLIATLTREEGDVYSLATSGDLLYTGSDSKNIRVWKNHAEFSGFKSSSGLVKAIVVYQDRKIFTGHQDGKIRVWKSSLNGEFRRIGTLPRARDYLKTSLSSYVRGRRHHYKAWLRHFDAISCLCIDEEAGLLYSGSWDKTVKVWRISDSKCLDSIDAHDDAVNSVAVGFGGLVFSGSADGTLKAWRREPGSGKHLLMRTLLGQESAVTAVAVMGEAGALYCGSSDGVVNVWERGRRMVCGEALRGGKMAVLCLATAGRLVMSGSADATVCVWGRTEGGTHVRVALLEGHTGPVKCLAVAEEEAREGSGRWVVYSGGLDKSVKVWRVDESHVMDTHRHVIPTDI